MLIPLIAQPGTARGAAPRRARRAFHSGSVLLIGLLFGLGGCLRPSPPEEKEIARLVESEWKSSPVIYLKPAVGGQPPTALARPPSQSTTIMSIAVGTAEDGQFWQSGGATDTFGPRTGGTGIQVDPTAGPTKLGPKIKIWPLKARINWTHQDTYALGAQKEVTEEQDYACFLYQDKDGAWKVTFAPPAQGYL
ncbi:MAG: hypothetical protein AB1714_04725 [Acidobacteriota bacterium]